MGTTDVSILTLRIQELEKENARLKAIWNRPQFADDFYFVLQLAEYLQYTSPL